MVGTFDRPPMVVHDDDGDEADDDVISGRESVCVVKREAADD